MLELATEAQQVRCHLGTAVERGLNAGKNTTVIPEHARVARATLGVPLGDQFDRAQRSMHRMNVVGDGMIVPFPVDKAIRQDADSNAESYGYAARSPPARVVFAP